MTTLRHLETGHPLKFLDIKCCDFMSQGHTSRSNKHVVRLNHLSAGYQLRPDPGMDARLNQVKWLHEDGSQNLFNVLLSPCFASSVRSPFNSVK